MVGRQGHLHPVSHLSRIFPRLLPLNHADRFEQNPLLNRLGLEVVAFSQVKLFAQFGGEGELKKPPELEQCHQVSPPYLRGS